VPFPSKYRSPSRPLPGTAATSTGLHIGEEGHSAIRICEMRVMELASNSLVRFVGPVQVKGRRCRSPNAGESGLAKA
jgi:hypothetical protein